MSHAVKDRNGPDDSYVVGDEPATYKWASDWIGRWRETAITMYFALNRFCESLGTPRMHT